MQVVVQVMKYLRLAVFTVLLSQARRIRRIAAAIVAACVAIIHIATTIISKYRVGITKRFAGPGKQFWERAGRGAPRLRFWPLLIWQTLTARDLRILSHEMCDHYQVQGLDYLPTSGVFTLAANHTMRRWTPRSLATIHRATLEKRPDLGQAWLVIVGYKELELAERGWLMRFLIKQMRRFYARIYLRWQYNILRLPMGNNRASMQALREWRRRAKQQPTLVLPEGRGAKAFEEIRPGAGRMLASLEVPILPVSVSWQETEQRWQVIFGPPIQWSNEARLHDLQIGLEIALALPAAEAPRWQTALAQWQAANEQ